MEEKFKNNREVGMRKKKVVPVLSDQVDKMV